MGIFDSIGGWFEGAANTVAGVATSTANTVADGVTSAAQSAADASVAFAGQVSNWTAGAVGSVAAWTSGAYGEVSGQINGAAFFVADEAKVLGTTLVAGGLPWMVLVPVPVGGAQLKAPSEGGPRPVAIGERVHDRATGKIYLVIDGGLRHIPNPATYDNLFRSWSGVSEIGPAASYPIGSPITDGAYLAKGTADGKVFLVVDGHKRWIVSPQVFDRFGFKWEAIRDVGAARLNALPDGPTVTGEYIPDGRRVRYDANDAVYLMIGGQLRHIPDMPTYENLFRDTANIASLHGPQAVGPALTQGAHLAKGTPDGKVFLMTDGKKNWISSPAVFDRYAFAWNKIRDLPAAQLAAIPDGPTVN